MMIVVALCASSDLVTYAKDSLAKLQDQYQSETDPVRKAKILAKLEPMEIEQAHAILRNGTDEESLAALEQARDQVTATAGALSAAIADPEKHPAGFKELQIGLRESVRRLDDLIVSVPYDKRPFFQAIRSDLTATQNMLIAALFPTISDKAQKRAKQ